MPKDGYFDIPFGLDGTRATVPDDVQPDGSVSYDQGYGIDYTLDPATNPSALNIEQAKFNQIIYDITVAIQQLQQTGIPPFIDATMTDDGNPFPYVQYAQVLYNGVAYQSLIDDNTDTPPTANWVPVDLTGPNVFTGGTTTGSANSQVLASLSPPAGFSMSNNGQTIICTAGFTNTNATQFAITSLGISGVAIKKLSGMSVVPLTGGEIVATNTINLVVNTANNCLLLQSSLSLGTAAYKNASGSGATVPTLDGAVTAGNAAIFKDSSGTIQDGGTTLRTKLTGDTTFYVATTGSDANNGTAIGTPWQHLQFAWDTICTLYDLNGHTATLQVADGTYTAGLAAKIAPFGGNVIINGNSGSPANVIVSTTNANAIAAGDPGYSGVALKVQNMKLTTTTGGTCLFAQYGSKISVGAGVNFAASAGYHMLSTTNSQISCLNDYAISGGAQRHIAAVDNSGIIGNALTVTITNTPVFSTAFATAETLGYLEAGSNTYTGSATGPRYSGSLNGVFQTAGGGANYFPGNSAGSVTSGAQYS